MTVPYLQALIRAGSAPNACPYALARALQAYAGAQAQIYFDHQDAHSLGHTDSVGMQRLLSDANPKQDTYRITTSFFGLTGAASPLPQETVAALQTAMTEEGGEALQALIRLIHHRLLTLLHDGVQASHPASAATEHRDDAWSRRLLAWAPVGATPVTDSARLAHFWALSKPVCNDQDLASAMTAVLHRYALKAAVWVEPLTGGLCPLAAEDVWKLGACQRALGEDTVLGHVALQPAASLRLHIQPEAGPVFMAWQKVAAEVVAEMRALCGVLLPTATFADVVLRPIGQQLPPWRLGPAKAPQADGLQGLGRSTFFKDATTTAHIPWFRSAEPGLPPLWCDEELK
jgi:predicted component of type VI protein secretion system